MMKQIKEYFEYKKNLKTAKRELAGIAASTLPAIREIADKGSDIVEFVIRLADETKGIENDKLVEMALNEISHALQAED